KNIMRLETDGAATLTLKRHSASEVFTAFVPSLLLVVFVLAWGEPRIKAAIDTWTNGLLPASWPKNTAILNGLNVPGLHNMITRIPPVTARPAPYPAVFALNWLTASGTACFLATIAAA